MERKVYPPQPWIHQADCKDAPTGLLVFKARSVRQAYPYGRPHTCFHHDTIMANRDCVAEPGEVEPHPYVKSTIWPADATGPLCHTCRGSHPESAIAALSTRRRDSE